MTELAPGLHDAIVALEPLALEHVDALCAAAVDRATFALAPVPRDRGEMVGYVERALADRAARRAVPYAVRAQATGAIVGSLRFMSCEWWSWPPGPIAVAGEPRDPATAPPDVAEIGHAWLAPHAQRTAINTAACRLMLTHAFEVWRVHRLTLKTDARNQRSREAIARLGAQFEGVLRAHLPAADGVIRDTAMFSIVPPAWPAIKARLTAALGAAA